MLPIHSLDDELFEDIVDDAKKMMMNLTGEWEEGSQSDPGITFIELFAWLKEMQQYYLNQISVKNKYKYLKLLGKKQDYDRPASAVVTINNVKKQNILPKKCKFMADEIVFETIKKEKLFPVKIEKFYTTQQGQGIISKSEKEWDKKYYVFGKEPLLNNTFNICFSQSLPKNEVIDILFEVYEDYQIKRNPIGDEEFYHLADIQWEYYSIDGWSELEIARDSTNNFINTGTISFKLSQEMLPYGECEEFIIRAVIKENNYDVSPIIEYISINSIKVVQKDTYSEILEFNVSKDDIQEFVIDNYLGITEEFEIYAMNEFGQLEIIDEFDFFNKNGLKTIVLDRKKHKKFPIEGKGNLRICTYLEQFNCKRNIETADGFPSFIVDLNFPNICYEDFEIYVSLDSEGSCWETWRKTEDLYLEDCKSKKYFLDLEQNKIVFGDGVHGKIPNGIIRIISLSTTLSNKGNVKKGEIDKALWPINEETIINYKHACGGKKSSTIDELFAGVRKNLKKVTRAVTDKDYEEIVKSTPGLMINNAKAITNQEIDSVFVDENPNCVYIVAQPYNDVEKKGLNKAYIKNIRRNLEKYRLITTEIQVISAQYIPIVISGEIRVKSYFHEADKIIQDTVKEYFDECTWNFGQQLSYSDLYGTIDMLECVNSVRSLVINFQGKGASKNNNGDIIIPKNSMIYLKECTFITSDD